MSVRATRLLRLLDELRRRRGAARGVVLAERLGISLRTLYRDIDALRAQGVDIAGEAGVGYQLKPGFLLPPMMFSTEELEGIVLGTRWVAAHADPQLAAAAERALDRIVGVLPNDLRLEVETSGLFAPDWAPVKPEPWLPLLRQGIRDGHVLRMQYRDGEGQATERLIWPFAMAFLADRRMLAAWCETREDFRHFRADRIVSLEDTGKQYPEGRHRLLHRWRRLHLRQRSK